MTAHGAAVCPYRHRVWSGRPARGGASRQAQGMLVLERGWRLGGVCVHTGNPVEDAARDGAEPLRLARTALLRGPHGQRIRRLGTIGYPSQQIAKAVTWLKRNFVQPLRVDGLADRAHMSPSTLRQHFRAITGVSPLQFQKQSRLGAARSPSNGIHEV